MKKNQKQITKHPQDPQEGANLKKQQMLFIKYYYRKIASLTEKEMEKENFEDDVIVESMKKATYNPKGTKDVRQMIELGREILGRHESALTSKEVFSQIGLSVRQIALNLRKLALTAKTETVRLNALNIASKCVGLQRESVDLEAGAEINIISAVANKGEKQASLGQAKSKMRICIAGGEE